MLATFAVNAAGEPIPAELVAKLKKSREVGKGVWTRQQMFYAAYALRVHQEKAPLTLDPSKLMEKIQGDYSMVRFVPGTQFWANWTHLNGYSAMYYTYMWSLVIAKDLFSPFEKAGIMDPATAAKYRENVLAPGGSKPAADLVKDFLGRPYGFESFARWLDR